MDTLIDVVLRIDTSRRIVGLHGYTALLEAVEGAGQEDEDEYIEWKRTLDLSSTAGAFAVARAILGFANRDPSIAARRFEGCAYLIVGAEPRACEGVTPVDPAVLSSKIDPYVGGVGGPAWDARFIERGGVSVLVVAIEPPRAGDPGWPLMKEYGSAAGTLFVRRKGATSPANPDEVRMLFRRAAAEAPTPFDLACFLEPDIPLRRLNVAGYLDHVRSKAEEAAATMRREAAELATAKKATVERAVGAEVLGIDPELLAAVFKSVSALGGLGLERSRPDRRSLEDFHHEVDDYVADQVEWAAVAWPAAAWSTLDDVRLKVVNTTDTYLTGVRVAIRFDDDRVIPLEDEPEEPDPPPMPRKFGEPEAVQSNYSQIHSLLSGLTPSVPHLQVPRVPFDTWLEDGRTIVFSVGKLHPRGTAISDPIRILVPAEVIGPNLTATGSATAEGHHRVIDIRMTVQTD